MLKSPLLLLLPRSANTPKDTPQDTRTAPRRGRSGGTAPARPCAPRRPRRSFASWSSASPGVWCVGWDWESVSQHARGGASRGGISPSPLSTEPLIPRRTLNCTSSPVWSRTVCVGVYRYVIRVVRAQGRGCGRSGGSTPRPPSPPFQATLVKRSCRGADRSHSMAAACPRLTGLP